MIRSNIVIVMLAAATLPLGACSSDTAGTQHVEVPAVGLVVVNGDYHTTSVSLVDPATRAVVRDGCVTSGSVPSDLSLALSGDVTLASRQQPGNLIVLLDGTNDSVSWVDPQTCTITKQLRVSPATFMSYPHDVIAVADDKVYVTRYARNGDSAAAPADAGDDIVIVDPKAAGGPAVTGRIDLAPFATAVAGKSIEAHPDHGVLAGGKVYLALGNQSVDYADSAPGRVVAIDPSTDQVTGMIDLPGLEDCSRVDYVEASKTLVVSCGGSFADGPAQPASSGIALVDVGAEPAVVKKIVSGTTLGGSVNFNWVLAFADDNLFAATLGTLDPATYEQTSPDAVYAVDGVAGTGTKLLEGGAFDLGRAAGGGTPRTVFVPDAKASGPLVHVIDASVSPPVEVSTFEPNPSTHLAPREIGWY